MFKYKGLGDMEELVEVWDSIFEQVEKPKVIQRKTMSGFASMKIDDGKWVVELGS